MSMALRLLIRVLTTVSLAALSMVVFRDCRQSGSPPVADSPATDRIPNAERLPLVSVAVTNLEAANEVRDVDLGKVIEGAELRHTFSIHNTTAKPLKVVAIKKSCGCESINLKEGTVVGPGGQLEVTYALSKYGAGDRKGHLVITTDAEDKSLHVIELNLRAQVQAKVWTTPTELQLAASDPTEQLLRVEAVVPGLLDSFKDFSTNRDNVVVRLKEKSADALTFGVTVAPNAPWGTSYDLIYLTFDNREKPLLSIRTQIRKGHPLAIIPATLKLPLLEENQPQVRKVRILSPAATTAPFRITNVECPDGIVVGDIPAEPRHTFDVNLTFTKSPAALSEPGDEQVVFHTEPPGAVTLTVRHDNARVVERNIP